MRPFWSGNYRYRSEGSKINSLRGTRLGMSLAKSLDLTGTRHISLCSQAMNVPYPLHISSYCSADKLSALLRYLQFVQLFIPTAQSVLVWDSSGPAEMLSRIQASLPRPSTYPFVISPFGLRGRKTLLKCMIFVLVAKFFIV